MGKPSLYLNNSTLFPWGKKKKTKVLDRSVELPDDQNEDLQPDEEEGVASVVSGDEDLQRSEALEILKSFPVVKPETPDMTGALEGKFSVSVEEMITQLNRIISAEYSEWMRWYHYALVLKGHGRDSLADKFEEHAEDELGHASVLALRVIALGGYPATDMEHPKHLSATSDIIQELIFREQEGIKLYRDVLALCGDNEGTRQVLEGNVEAEQDHLDELWRWSKGEEEVAKAGADQESAGSHTFPSEVQAKRTADNSYKRRAIGISGTSTPDLPEVGRDWHGTVPGVPDEPQDTEEEKAEDVKTFAPPKDVFGLKKKPQDQPNISKSMASALSVLDSIPQFDAPHQFSSREREYLLSKGFSLIDIDTGNIEITSRMCQEFRTHIRGVVTKSINSLQSYRR